MKQPTYGAFMRESIREEAAKLKGSKYWANISPNDRGSWLLGALCRRCRLKRKELLELLRSP